MREIKFRGMKRNPYGDRWVYGYYAIIEGTPSIICPHLDGIQKAVYNREPMNNKSVYHEVDVKTIGQYTGLKDKNGVEIYEGDIVELNNNKKDLAIVKFGAYLIRDIETEDAIDESVGWYLKPIENCSLAKSEPFCYEGSLNTTWIEDLNISVIGNIYENKEL